MAKFTPIGSGQKIDIQTFTTDGTWTKPAGALWCQVLMVSGGNGGNGGGYAESNGVAGNGGDGVSADLMRFPAVMFPATAAVVVGVGGAGGAGATAEAGAAGAAGTASSFGPFTCADGYTDNLFTFDGDYDRSVAYKVSGNGSPGGGVDSGGDDGIASEAPFYMGGEFPSAYSFSNGGAGGAASANGAAGGALDIGGGGGGGGGGAVTATSAGGNGGKGGAYGGGGGGGGAGDGTYSGGDGGDGGDGVVIVWTVCNG